MTVKVLRYMSIDYVPLLRQTLVSRIYVLLSTLNRCTSFVYTKVRVTSINLYFMYCK